MSKNKIIAIILIIIGVALLLGSAAFWYDGLKSANPPSAGESVRDWITTITGVISCIIGVLTYFKKDKKEKITEIKATGNSAEFFTGENAKKIEGDYIEKQVNVFPEKTASLDSLHQLPAPPADFTGRAKEIDEITGDLQKGVTISGLHGMGGIGKTALGLVIAQQLKNQFPAGQIFLDLRGAHAQEPLTPAEAMRYVLLSFEPEAKLPQEEAVLEALYCSVLEGKKVLLFFDNARGPEQVTPLLPPPGNMTLVTSRQHFNLPGLAAHNLDTLAPQEARGLIRKIARGVKAEEAEGIARQCGYLPLALRLAAGMLNTRPDWTPADLIEKLQDALRTARTGGSLAAVELRIAG